MNVRHVNLASKRVHAHSARFLSDPDPTNDMLGEYGGKANGEKQQQKSQSEMDRPRMVHGDDLLWWPLRRSYQTPRQALKVAVAG